jgi:type IV secretory pathway component VirB8
MGFTAQITKWSKILMEKIEATTSRLAIEGHEKAPHYIEQLESEHSTIRQTYYLWISRLFIVTATLSMSFFVLASLSLFHLAPMVTVEPFLITNQSESENIVRNELIERKMASKEAMMEMYIRQYVSLRNTIINDPIEMRTRWMSGGMINYLSAPDVYNAFGRSTQKIWDNIFKQSLVREVELISAKRVGGQNSAVWKVDFKTYDLYNEQGQSQAQQETTLRVRYWTSSLTAYFIPDRAFMSPRLVNPLGFTVTRYSQTEVDIF